MRLIRLTEEHIARVVDGRDVLPPAVLGSCAVALGSFDGVHRGHLELVRGVQEAKRRLDLAASCLFTFRRHPRLVLQPETPPFLLTTWREKLALLATVGVDAVVAVDFCPALAALPYDEFVRRFLVDFLGMRHFVAGHDVHLGAGRGGNAQTLAALGERLGYAFEVFPALRDGDRVVSSSAIREALARGDPETAAAMLGRPYALWGEVVPGEGRGRTIGFPTANVAPLFAKKYLPQPGVYAVRIQLPGDAARAGARDGVLARVVENLPEVDRDGDLIGLGPSEWAVFAGMLNHGKVPTFHAGGLSSPRVEVHVLEFDGDLRGRTVKVEWVRRLRDEMRFGSAEELVAQLARDRQRTRQALGLEA